MLSFFLFETQNKSGVQAIYCTDTVDCEGAEAGDGCTLQALENTSELAEPFDCSVAADPTRVHRHHSHSGAANSTISYFVAD